MKIVRSLKNLSPDDPFLTQVHHEVQSIFLPLQQGLEIWTDFSQNPRKETNKRFKVD